MLPGLSAFAWTPRGFVARMVRDLHAEVWIAHLAGNGTGPDLQNVKIEPNAMWESWCLYRLGGPK